MKTPGTVIDKLRDAASSAAGIRLTAAEVEMLHDRIAHLGRALDAMRAGSWHA